MIVKILGPVSRQSLDVEWIDVATTQGSHIIMPGHAPFTVQIAPNTQLALGLLGGATKSIPITNGILHVDRNAAMVILDE